MAQRKRPKPRPDQPPQSSPEPSLDRAWASYSASFRQEIMPQLLSSAVMLALYDGDMDHEIQFATQLGLMLIYDKPIVLLAPPGVTIPERLRALAVHTIDGYDPAVEPKNLELVAALRAAGIDDDADA